MPHAELASLPPLVEPKSELTSRLLTLVGWGHLSANTARWLAEGAIIDGADRTSLHTFARLGKDGEYAGNVRRDLLRTFSKHLIVPTPVRVHRPEKDKQGRIISRDQFFNSPMAIVESLFQRCPSAFADIFGAEPGNFWSSIRDDDPKFALLDHVRADPHWRSQLIPIVLHGDGGKFTTKNEESLVCLQWKSLCCKNKFGNGICPFFVLPKSIRANPGTVDDTAHQLYVHVVHFLNAALEGIHPRFNPSGGEWPAGSFEAEWAGQPFCNGRFKIVVWGLTGDLEWFSNELGYPHFNSLEPCWMCLCSRRRGTAVPITDVLPTASWKATKIPHATGARTKVSEHVLMTITGVTRFHYPGDLMHAGGGGVCLYVLGSVLYELVYENPGCRDARRNLERVWGMIHERYSRWGMVNRFTGLTLAMIGPERKTPKLKGKCADSQSLVWVMADICRAVHDGSDHDEHRCCLLESLAQFLKLVEDSPMVLPDAVADNMVAEVEKTLLHNNVLMRQSVVRGVVLYPHHFKHHVLYHIADHSRFLNPKWLWCFEWEDFVGDMITTAKSCTPGSSMGLVCNKVIENWLLVMNLSVNDHYFE